MIRVNMRMMMVMLRMWDLMEMEMENTMVVMTMGTMTGADVMIKMDMRSLTLRTSILWSI
jgi:hypothetical protein